MNLEVAVRFEGERTVFRDRLLQILNECPELTWQTSIPDAWRRICASTESIDRYEIIARDDAGALLGFAVAVEDHDDHVGPCLGVQWRYVFPEGRGGVVGRALQRAVINLARQGGYYIIAYTKRLGAGRYEINYRKLKEKRNG